MIDKINEEVATLLKSLERSASEDKKSGLTFLEAVNNPPGTKFRRRAWQEILLGNGELTVTCLTINFKDKWYEAGAVGWTSCCNAKGHIYAEDYLANDWEVCP